MSRIAQRFAALRSQSRKALVCFITAGDPDYDRSLAVLRALPAAGADLIELGMPFSDPMADGPAIQASSLRALAAGASMRQTLRMVRDFRATDAQTPLVLMGYFNPLYVYGVARFVQDAAQAGVDGLIVVDLPPEEDPELRVPARAAGLDLIRLVTPTTDSQRLPVLLKDADGFLYYVSVAGITGAASAQASALAEPLARLREASALPVVVGFGIKTPRSVAEIAPLADGVVVGSALVECIAGAGGDPVVAATAFVGSLKTSLQETMS